MSGIGPAMDAVTDSELVVPEAPPAKSANATAQPVERNEVAAATTAATARPANTGAVVAAAPDSTVAPVANANAAATAAAPITSMPVPPAKTVATTQVPARPAVGQGPNTAGSFGGTVFALLLVIGLILALGWMAKRMPGFGRGASSNGLRLVASLPVGARERVVVVEVGQTQLLLGIGAGGTRTLHTLSEPLPEAGVTATPQFAQLLAQHFGKKA